MSQTARLSEETTGSPGIPERAILQYEVEQFLYHEAALLDDRRFSDWFALIADDIRYWMPIRRTVTLENLHLEYAKADGMAYFDDDKTDLRMRVEKLQSNSAWSENPPSRTRHFVSNVRILEVTGAEIAVEANVHLYRSRLNDKIDNWIGKRRDRLRRVDGGFQIFERNIFLDQTVACRRTSAASSRGATSAAPPDGTCSAPRLFNALQSRRKNCAERKAHGSRAWSLG